MIFHSRSPGRWLGLLVLLVAMTACTTTTPNVVDTQAPTVTSTDPPDGSTEVPVDEALVIAYSEAMNRPDAEAAVTITPAVDCSFSWNSEGTAVTCQPLGGLSADTTYTVTVTDAEDLAGNPLSSPVSFSFTTGDSTSSGETVCVFDDAAATFDDCVFGA